MSMRSILELNDDVLDKIAENLDEKDRCMLSSTCKTWRSLIRSRPVPTARVFLASNEVAESLLLWVRERGPLHSLHLELSPTCQRYEGALVIHAIECLFALVSSHLVNLSLNTGRVNIVNPVSFGLMSKLEHLSIESKDGCFSLDRVTFPRRLHTLHVDGSFPTTIGLGPSEIPSLTALSLTQCSICNLDYMALQLAPNLKELCLDRNRMTNMRSLPPLPRLEKLSMRRCSILNIPDLSSCPLLKDVDLSINSIIDRDDPERTFDALSNLKQLERLNISHNALTRRSVSSIGIVANVKFLDISGNVFRNVPSFFPKLESLKMLVVSKVPKSSILHTIPRVRRVHIHDNCPYCPKHRPFYYDM